ncbi:hypothetical protein PR202_gb27460 [Eleusine coracana subsp. coracana]|uniref:KIB1-4 beta-propeller domain-containing protein n=1 Tax=Eleusine coracana subsp. coracana TaxID=191504 RepID=A0AAV5FUI5_ELECO|nr:hypothetical protein PR202_gb27460 [Eleusine coracana subsp. coracana]
MAGWGHRRQEWRLKRQPAAEPAVRRRQEWRLKKHLSPKSTPTSEAEAQVIIGTCLVDLPLEIIAEIHSRLGFLDRLNFATVLGVGAARRLLSTEAPCLLLPGDTADKSTFFSVADRQVAVARAVPDPAMRDHVVVGSSSSGGWIVTADLRGALRMANPVTGEQAELPEITTGNIPFGYRSLVVKLQDFAKIRFGGRPAATEFIQGVSYSSGWQMRKWFYRKVVLSASPRPDNYAAMLILDEKFGSPAFATADDPAWRLAMSPDGVEDAIHHNGRFYSITYSGIVETWDRHAETGEYRGTAVGPRLLVGEEVHHLHCRKYIAAAPDGRLMAVLIKEYKKLIRTTYDSQPIPVFKVLVLDEPRKQCRKYIASTTPTTSSEKHPCAWSRTGTAHQCTVRPSTKTTAAMSCKTSACTTSRTARW